MRVFYSVTDTRWLSKNTLCLVVESYGNIHAVFKELFSLDEINAIGITTQKPERQILVSLTNGTEYISKDFQSVVCK